MKFLGSYASLSNYNVDDPGSLGSIFYDALRNLYRTQSCGGDKELYIQSLFSGAYGIAEKIAQAERPSLHREEYERIAKGGEKEDVFRGEVIMAMVYHLFKFNLFYHENPTEIKTLLEDIEEYSFKNKRSFFEELSRRCENYRPTDKDLQRIVDMFDKLPDIKLDDEMISVAYTQGYAHFMAKSKFEEVIQHKEEEIEKLRSEVNQLHQRMEYSQKRKDLIIQRQETIISEKEVYIKKLESEREFVENVVEDEKCDSERLDTAQVIMLFESLLNVSLDPSHTNISALSKLIAKVSGYKEGSVRTKINQKRDYDNAKAKKDAEMLLELLKPIDKEKELLVVSRLKENLET